MRTKKDAVAGYLFLAPALVAFVLFMLLPVIISLVLSFCDWNLISGIGNIRFVGAANFIDLIKDDWFADSLLNNLRYSLVVVTATMALSLLLAYLINDKVYAKSFLRAAFFLPYIANIAAISIVWLALYQPSQGPLRMMIQGLGLTAPRFLANPKTALNAIMVMTVWVGIGYNMIIYLAGLQDVPASLYEAADIDGANALGKFVHVTLPGLSHTTFFLIMTTIINSFQVFGPINIMTQGGPARSTTVLTYYMYQLAFRFYDMGHACAVAWVLFAMVFVITVLQFLKRKEELA